MNWSLQLILFEEGNRGRFLLLDTLLRDSGEHLSAALDTGCVWTDNTRAVSRVWAGDTPEHGQHSTAPTHQNRFHHNSVLCVCRTRSKYVKPGAVQPCQHFIDDCQFTICHFSDHDLARDKFVLRRLQPIESTNNVRATTSTFHNNCQMKCSNGEDLAFLCAPQTGSINFLRIKT